MRLRGCRVRGKLLLLREHLLADGQGVVLDRCEGDALRVVHHEGARARARAAVLGAVRRAGALRAPLEAAHLGAERRRQPACRLDDGGDDARALVDQRVFKSAFLAATLLLLLVEV